MLNDDFNKQLQKLSNYVYTEDRTKKPDGWIEISQKQNRETGFYAKTFVKGKNMVIVFRGTDVNRGYEEARNDVLNDMDLYLGKIPSQTVDAREYYNETTKSFKGYSITFAGHSLGGSLGQIMGYETGKSAVTFGAYGVKDILQTNAAPGNVINYGNANDPVFIKNIDNQFGRTFVVNDYLDNKGYVHKSNGLNLNVSLDKHDIDNMGNISNAKEYIPLLNQSASLKGSVSYNDFSPERIITREEIKKMTPEEFAKNEKYIKQQLKEGKIMSEAEVKDKSKKEGGASKVKSSGSSGNGGGDGHWVTINGNHVLIEN